MPSKSDSLLIGAHTSASGGPHNALLEGKSIGATTIQLFTANQRRWDAKGLTQEAIEQWYRTLQETGLSSIMSHDSYLINLGSPDFEILDKSRAAFKQEIERCIALGLTFLNFHPGAALKSDVQQCLDTIAESLLSFEHLLEQGPTTLLLETTAGQGSNVGYRFDQIAYILEKVKHRIPVGVCIDTCHIFAAGYDVRTPQAWEITLKEFDKIIGLPMLRAFHLNDSMKGLGSRIDRHSPLGKGEIGLDCFKFLMNDPRTQTIPKYLETPDGLELWQKEIEMLREFVR